MYWREWEEKRAFGPFVVLLESSQRIKGEDGVVKIGGRLLSLKEVFLEQSGYYEKYIIKFHLETIFTGNKFIHCDIKDNIKTILCIGTFVYGYRINIYRKDYRNK